MTKKRPGAARGRPKGSGAGLDVQVAVRLAPEVVEQLDAHASARSVDRSELIRGILGRWVKRQEAPR